MIGTAADFLRFLEAIRQGGAPILQPATVEQMTTLHVPPDRMAVRPGVGFGYGWSVLADPATAQSPQAAGTLQWGGVYGHTWFVDRKSGISSVLMTNTALEGMIGPLTVEVRDAVYGV
jgi:CubicO group peptidase (beta-lactamase class C family)